jgi:nucleoid DNA-binding protein
MTYIKIDKNGDGKNVDKHEFSHRIHKILNEIQFQKKPIFKHYISYEKAVVVLNAIIDELGHAISESETVVIPNFGKFKKKHKNSRIGTNPYHNNERMIIPAKTTTVFRASVNLGKKHYAEDEEQDYVND